mmetsp:Transcript_39120/g.85343  ORF Transcript_39120/g.85343 Transcript_39120/m.85343 type:complete len:470 (-) Transcript_39120:40-1449(-)
MLFGTDDSLYMPTAEPLNDPRSMHPTQHVSTLAQEAVQQLSQPVPRMTKDSLAELVVERQGLIDALKMEIRGAEITKRQEGRDLVHDQIEELEGMVFNRVAYEFREKDTGLLFKEGSRIVSGIKPGSLAMQERIRVGWMVTDVDSREVIGSAQKAIDEAFAESTSVAIRFCVPKEKVIKVRAEQLKFLQDAVQDLNLEQARGQLDELDIDEQATTNPKQSIWGSEYMGHLQSAEIEGEPEREPLPPGYGGHLPINELDLVRHPELVQLTVSGKELSGPPAAGGYGRIEGFEPRIHTVSTDQERRRTPDGWWYSKEQFIHKYDQAAWDAAEGERMNMANLTDDYATVIQNRNARVDNAIPAMTASDLMVFEQRRKQAVDWALENGVIDQEGWDGRKADFEGKVEQGEWEPDPTGGASSLTFDEIYGSRAEHGKFIDPQRAQAINDRKRMHPGLCSRPLSQAERGVVEWLI